MRFEEPVSDKEWSYDRKGTARLRFDTRTDTERYTFDIRIYPNGSATIHVAPLYKQSITYHGQLAPAKEEKVGDEEENQAGTKSLP